MVISSGPQSFAGPTLLKLAGIVNPKGFQALFWIPACTGMTGGSNKPKML